MGTLCCWNNDRTARFQHFAHPQRIRCYLRNCDEHSLGAATGPSAPPVLCFSLCAAQLCVSCRCLPLLLLGTETFHEVPLHLYAMFFGHVPEVLLQLCDTMGLCVHVPVWCTCFACALQDACLPCWMLASSLFVCVAATLTTHVNNGCFSLCVDFSCAPTLLSLSN